MYIPRLLPSPLNFTKSEEWRVTLSFLMANYAQGINYNGVRGERLIQGDLKGFEHPTQPMKT